MTGVAQTLPYRPMLIGRFCNFCAHFLVAFEAQIGIFRPLFNEFVEVGDMSGVTVRALPLANGFMGLLRFFDPGDKVGSGFLVARDAEGEAGLS